MAVKYLDLTKKTFLGAVAEKRLYALQKKPKPEEGVEPQAGLKQKPMVDAGISITGAKLSAGSIIKTKMGTASVPNTWAKALDQQKKKKQYAISGTMSGGSWPLSGSW